MAPCVSIVPEGVLAYGLQLPVQALSVRTSSPWEREHSTVQDMVDVARGATPPGSSTSRCAITSRFLANPRR